MTQDDASPVAPPQAMPQQASLADRIDGIYPQSRDVLALLCLAALWPEEFAEGVVTVRLVVEHLPHFGDVDRARRSIDRALRQIQGLSAAPLLEKLNRGRTLHVRLRRPLAAELESWFQRTGVALLPNRLRASFDDAVASRHLSPEDLLAMSIEFAVLIRYSRESYGNAIAVLEDALFCVDGLRVGARDEPFLRLTAEGFGRGSWRYPLGDPTIRSPRMLLLRDALLGPLRAVDLPMLGERWRLLRARVVEWDHESAVSQGWFDQLDALLADLERDSTSGARLLHAEAVALKVRLLLKQRLHAETTAASRRALLMTCQNMLDADAGVEAQLTQRVRLARVVAVATIQIWLSALAGRKDVGTHLDAARLAARRALTLSRTVGDPVSARIAMEVLILTEWAQRLAGGAAVDARDIQYLYVLHVAANAFGALGALEPNALADLMEGIDRVLQFTPTGRRTIDTIEKFEETLALARKYTRAAAAADGPLAYGMPLVEWTAGLIDEMERIVKLRLGRRERTGGADVPEAE